jgi:hypothetical protein
MGTTNGTKVTNGRREDERIGDGRWEMGDGFEKSVGDGALFGDE